MQVFRNLSVFLAFGFCFLWVQTPQRGLLGHTGTPRLRVFLVLLRL